MKIGNVIRDLIDRSFPDRVSRAITYSENEIEVVVKYRNQLPSAKDVGRLTSMVLDEMAEGGYPKFGNVHASTEGAMKMTITIKAKSHRLMTNQKPLIDEPEFSEEDTVGTALGNDDEGGVEFKPILVEEPKPDLNTDKEDKVLSLTLAMEYGYLQCEKGNNLTQALINFEKTLKGKGKK